MISLNGDCLDYIFKMLPIGDRINMIISYQNFYDIFRKRLRIEYKTNLNTKFFNTLQTFQLQVLLSIIGSYIKHLKIEFPFEEQSYLREFIYFKFLFTYCINVESLKYFGWSVNDESMKYLKSLRNLKSLAIINNSEITENINCLAQLPQLKQLELWRDNIISPPITKEFLCNLAQYQAKQLDSLKLVDCSSFDEEKASLVAQLENLKVLHCICNPCDEAIMETFSNLSKLEELYINNSYFITNRSVLQLLSKCPRVKRLNLRSCGLITADLIPNLLYLLKRQRLLHSDRVQIDLNPYKFSDKISEIELEDSPNVLKFSYKYLTHDYECLTQTIKILK
ncbi:hypothetical protein CVS40_6611 [Lucilia cuprina]|nr:hypothetical protein CVS40_6611 [Lucilia cuprina]